MKRHIKYIIYEVSPCKLGDIHRYVIKMYKEDNACKFIKSWYQEYDFNFTCLVLMKVLA